MDETYDNCPYCRAAAEKKAAAARQRYLRSRPLGTELYKCGLCGEPGHNIRTCPESRSAGEA